MNIAEILSEQALVRPDSIAIIDGQGTRRTISFAELDTASARAASFLRERGVKAGDAVLVFQPMSQELYIALIALFRLGCIATFLDPSAGRRHIDACCSLHPPSALIASSKAHLLRFVSPALRRIPLKFSIGWPVPGASTWRQSMQAEPLEKIESVVAGAPALLTFTSGSTGQPKAALRSHGFLLAQHQALASTLALKPGSLDLTTLPIFLLSNLASGVTSLIPNADLRRPGSIDGAVLSSQIAKEKPASIGASPALFERLVAVPGQSLVFQKIFTGGAPVFPRLLSQLQTLSPEAEITAVYGSTEAEPIAHVAFHDIGAKDIEKMQNGGGLLAGKPVDCIQLRILPDKWGQRIGPFDVNDFDAASLPPESVGEIVVSGAHVLPGYLNGQGDEETKFEVDGTRWHRTGDAGYMDRQGRLWLMGRCAARIEDEHGTLYPFAVECAAMEQPGIQRTALVQRNGKRLLVVEMKEGIEVQREALIQALAWARIAEIEVLRRIPVDKRHNAKIDYPALHRLMGMERGRRG